MKKLPTYEEVSEKLEYDPETGLFRWRERCHGNQKEGWFAGGLNGHGYLLIRLNGSNYSAHRIAWLLQSKKWPVSQVDHINRDKRDNRIANLRDTSRSKNQHNRPHKGCSRSGSGYRSQLQLMGKRTCLGTYATPEDAQIAYWTAKNLLGLNPNYNGPTLL